MTSTKQIYEIDPWLEPFKEAINARHERILADKKKLIWLHRTERTTFSANVNGVMKSLTFRCFMD